MFINNEDFELCFVINFPFLSNFKLNYILPITGNVELKDMFYLNFIETFYSYFREHVIKIIIKKNKLKGADKKDLYTLNDAELIDVFEITKMLHI